jgi:hypothetical protein
MKIANDCARGWTFSRNVDIARVGSREGRGEFKVYRSGSKTISASQLWDDEQSDVIIQSLHAFRRLSSVAQISVEGDRKRDNFRPEDEAASARTTPSAGSVPHSSFRPRHIDRRINVGCTERFPQHAISSIRRDGEDRDTAGRKAINGNKGFGSQYIHPMNGSLAPSANFKSSHTYRNL